MKIRAPAKLNLRLEILAREESGYHSLETVFCAVELADELEMGSGNGLQLEVEGAELGPPEDNLVHRAAREFYRTADIEPDVRIRLRKNIPAGAGLGGGSSDAAATLRALNRRHGEPLDAAALLRIGAGLGSDVPFFVAGAPFALAWGRGERMLPLAPPPPAPVLLAVPEAAANTADAYRELDRHRRVEPAGPRPRPIHLGELESWDGIAATAANDFEPVVFRRRPELERLKRALAESGARLALLTGTGSAVFGVYGDPVHRDRAVEALDGRFPEVRLIPTATATAPVGG